MEDKTRNIDEIIKDINANAVPVDSPSRHKLEFSLVEESEVADSVSGEESHISPECTAEQKVKAEHISKSDMTSKDSPTVEHVGNMEKKSAKSTVWTTYVPRFTEASDNYRMANSSKAPAPTATVRVDAVKDDSATAVEPTAEIDGISESEEIKVVSVGAQQKENYDIQATVFKFDVSTSTENPVPIANEVSEPSLRELLEKSEDAEENSEPVFTEPTPKEYKIPDPEHAVIASVALAEKSALPQKRELVSVKGELAPASKLRTDFTANTSRDSFKDKFLDSLMSIKIRLVASIIVFLLAFVLEVLVLFNVDVAAILGFSSVVGALAVVDAIFTSCLFLLAVPEAAAALRSLVRKRAVPELFLIVSYALLMAYYVTVAALAANDDYSLFGVLYAIVSIASIVASLYKKQTEFSAFKAVSAVGEKTVINKCMTRTLTDESIAVDGKVEGYKSKIAHTCRTSFVTDFFKRAAKCSENSKNVLIVLMASIGCAFVSGAVAYFLLDGGVSLMSTAATVFMVSVPVIMILSHKLPYHYAQKEAEIDSTAIIGEATLYDCAGVDVMAFEDTDVFSYDDINLQRIMLYGKSENLTKALRQMSSLFSAIGGPLEHIFADSLDQVPVPATNLTVENDGIIGVYEGKTVMAGTLEFMVRKGLTIPNDTTVEKTLLSTKVMYAAEEGQVYAKFYIRYTLSEEFTMILPSLCDDGILPLVYTRDPNVTNELFRTLTAGSDSIRVLKKNDLPLKEDGVYERASSGIVTATGKSGIINALFTCKKYARFQTRIAVTELSAMIVGATLAVVLALAGITVIPAVVLGLWQVAWCGVLFFLSKRAFNTKKNKEKSDRKI